MNPEDSTTEEQSEMTEMTDMMPPAEDGDSAAPESEAMMDPEPPPAPPVVPSLDELIVQGAAGVQADLAALRESRTANHDATLHVSSAKRAADKAASAEEEAKRALGMQVEEQIANLQELKTSLAL